MQDLNEQNLKAAIEKVAEAKHPVSFSGAGLSAELGIATFRDGSDDALWAKFDPMKLASQEGFKDSPETVIGWYKDRRKTLGAASPNAAHLALGAQTGWIHITQNVDNLLEAGGADNASVIHLHGTLERDHCNSECGFSEAIDLNNPPDLRPCPECGDQMRPSVVWFGEVLPDAAIRTATDAVQRADLMLIIGTSAMVMPAASFIDAAMDNGADIIVINTEKSLHQTGNKIELVGKAGDLVPQLLLSEGT